MFIERVDDDDLLARLGQSSGPRTRDVLHVSTIYKSLMERLQPKRFDSSKPMDMRRIETGLLFETMLEQALAEKFSTVRPGEIISPEGVYMSPDGVNPAEGAGEEYKCTWMSSRVKDGTTPYTDENGQPNMKYLHWFIQVKAYAKYLSTDTFLLRVLHINGDYTYPLAPQFLTHRIRFTQQELDENWTMLTNHARSKGLL